MRSTIPCTSCAIATLIACAASAQYDASLQVTGGSTVVTTVTVKITSILGTSTDTDTKTLAVSGSSTGAFGPGEPPFTAYELDTLLFEVADSTFNFQFFCLPFVGCQDLALTVTDLELALTAPVSGPIGPGGNATAVDAPFAITGNFVAGGDFSGSGPIDGAQASNVAFRVTTPGPLVVRLDQISLESQVFNVPPESLPAGVSAVQVTIATNFANTAFEGPLTPPPIPGDLNGDGVVDGADLGDLLAAWGPCANCAACPADLNGDCVVDGADLGIQLANWG